MPAWAEEAEATNDSPSQLVEMTGVRDEYLNKYDFANKSLPDILAQFMAEHRLNEKNFSMSYEMSDGSLRFDFAESVFRTAASTYKLPLNMYYYDLENNGEISPTAMIRGYRLDYIHRQSIVFSNNEVSEALYMNLGSFRHYRELMAQYCEQDYPSIYYSRNRINSAYMVCVLKRIYENSANYEQLIGYMKEGNPGEYFKQNDESVEIAHKYGWYDGAVNDVAIIYTEVPFFLSAYTQGVGGAGTILGQLSALMIEYSNYHIWQQKEAAAEAIEAARIAEEERLEKERIHMAAYTARVREYEAEMQNVYYRYIGILAIIALWVVALLVGVILFIYRRRERKNFIRYMKYYSIQIK